MNRPTSLSRRLVMLLVLGLVATGCNLESRTTTSTPQKTYEANWESIQQYEIPEWFADAKFGIFIHWGPYAVPAFGSEWYPRRMYEADTVRNAKGEGKNTNNPMYDHHVETYGGPDKFGYKDFIPEFKAENFNANEWLDLFESAGARYIIPVAEHHDGFAMYGSTKTRWNSVDMGPKRDVIGELAEATRARGLKFGASSHFAFNWNYYGRKEGWDTNDPEFSDLYSRPHEQYTPCDEEFLAHWWDRTTEIIDKYQPDVLWFDFYIDNEEFGPYHPKLAAYYYNRGEEWNRDVVLQTKNFSMESFPEGSNVLDIERGRLSKIHKFPWQTDTSVGKNSWGYVTNWKSKTPTTLIHDLVDIVSKNGCLLLNVGPKADGTIPQDQAEVLLEMGEWLNVNGEAIYETRPWDVFGEGPTQFASGHHQEKKNKAFTAEDLRFTQKEGALYAIMMEWPESSEVLITSLKDTEMEISAVELLGNEGDLAFEKTDAGLKVTLPAEAVGNHAYTIKISHSAS
ncbi:alpha-L-fucosidase [Pontibacter sp. G13]|uniref:alpha-L-fucosidase n=1 Tax=Pontibacter sp. G13 TaxID=3074898 RepID=UPI00288A946E|nr:alpha-L-fucosidase [Pontibacter sp. G13]WNJ20078.1 alpha-L-fucosidase [Pontibacter sp. G13]